MRNKTIALNLRRLRSAADLTQEQVADKAGLSRAAYRKIETGVSEPRVSNLQAIATALGVSIQDLVASTRALNAVRFRSRKRLRSREQILVDVSRWLSDFNELEDILGDKIENRLKRPLFRGQPTTSIAVQTAKKVRELFDVGPDEPIRDICGLLEAQGVKVKSHPIASNEFFGLSIAASDGGPAIVVNTWDRISVERWIFTAAHELGHLVLHLSDYDVSKTAETDECEKQANAFAATFLMPEAAFRKEWDETYGLPLIDRVLKVKRIFRVSYRTILYRLVEKKVVSKDIWAQFQTDYKRRYGRTLLDNNEPERLSRVDFSEGRLSWLVRSAVEKEKISLGRGAEILGISLQEMRHLASSWVG